jgi:hypothetical protein
MDSREMSINQIGFASFIFGLPDAWAYKSGRARGVTLPAPVLYDVRWGPRGELATPRTLGIGCGLGYWSILAIGLALTALALLFGERIEPSAERLFKRGQTKPTDGSV